jgi:hypothetical protein
MMERNIPAVAPKPPMDSQRYLVRVDPERFVKDIDGSCIDVTVVPSYARLFTDYNAACILSDRLRRKGYPQSCVCDPRGEPLTAGMLKGNQAAEEERQRRFWAKHFEE